MKKTIFGLLFVSMIISCNSASTTETNDDTTKIDTTLNGGNISGDTTKVSLDTLKTDSVEKPKASVNKK